ncbi:hypothetical protein N5I39_08965 [Klebsiella pneumoniae]|uniref:hypothetical protein n=1 Tax=Klebsiella pneumoniae TaxID=573 RepID=UPI0022473FDA|nr:hypothetical protein [Klebsiella pneumoniae]MCW9180941.1 hypothetical protein [Klebsiella pneumoniae]
MTNNQLTRERIELIANFHRAMTLPPSHDEIEELARMALAAMDSESNRNPVLAYADSYRDMAKQGVESVQIWSVITDLERNIAPLYRHAQPAPKTEREPIAWLNDAYLARGVVDGEAGSEDAGPGYIPVYREALPELAALVVPDERDKTIDADDHPLLWSFNEGWNACRAAMLQAEPVCTCPSGNGSLRWPCPVHPGNSPVIPDGYVMVPKEPTPEILAVISEAIRAMRGSAATYARVLAAAPQEVKGE